MLSILRRFMIVARRPGSDYGFCERKRRREWDPNIHGLTFVGAQVFLNVVLDDAVEEKAGGEKVRIGMVVCNPFSSSQRLQL